MEQLIEISDPIKINEILNGKFTGFYYRDLLVAESKGFTFNLENYIHANQIYTFTKHN